MRVDAHQHFWTYDAERYPWIGAGMERLRADFLPRDLERLLAASGLEASVAVQARQDLDETRWLLELAREHAFVAGVVGWVDLCSPAVEDELARLAGEPKLRGVRHVVQDEPDDAFLLRPDFQAGIARLARFGLVYDLLIHPRHLVVAAQLVDRFPDQPFVLDHLAKPFIARGELEPWGRHLRALARRPNVHAKLSGLVTEARWTGWSAADFAPYLDLALEAFGPRRLMFGSDWPVCTLAAEYAEVRAIVDDWAAELAPSEHAALFGDNAARFYGLAGTP